MTSDFARFVLTVTSKVRTIDVIPPSYMSSDIVQLIAKGGSRFLVHKDVLASQSKPFNDALTGEWKESQDRRIELPDWDAVTIGRMVEFLYRGSYCYPDPAALTPGDPKLLQVVGPRALAISGMFPHHW